MRDCALWRDGRGGVLREGVDMGNGVFGGGESQGWGGGEGR